MTTYRRRSETVDAVQWTGDNLAAMPFGSFRHPDWDDVLVMPCRCNHPEALTVMLPLAYWAVTDGEGHNAARSDTDFAAHFERVEG